MLITPGQAADSGDVARSARQVAVPRLVGGPPRRIPDTVIADKAYSAVSNRDLLRRKRIRSVIPQRSGQVANRKKRGRRGGRPPGFDKVEYNDATWSSARSTRPNTGAQSRLATTNSPLTYRARIHTGSHRRMAQIIGRHDLDRGDFGSSPEELDRATVRERDGAGSPFGSDTGLMTGLPGVVFPSTQLSQW